MDVRTYRAKSLAEALRLVRQDLGPQASVLHTRQVGGGTWRWLVGGPEVEVTASSHVQAPAILRAVVNQRLPRADLLDFRSQYREHLRRQRSARISALEDMVPHASHRDEGLASLLSRLGRQLTAQQIEPHAASQLIEELRDVAELEGLRGWHPLCQQLVQLVAARIAIGPPVRLLPARRRVVALVGPTGVGKTITTAKLATSFHRQGKRVALISDRFRVAAIDQLWTYAEMTNLPIEVVASAHQLRAALDRLWEMDLVLLDTAGVGPRDHQQIRQLTDLLAQAKPNQTLLVLAGVAATSSLAAAVETFAAVGARAVVLTKVDEVATAGNLLPLLTCPSLPVSYITAGQNVPHDIHPAHRQQLAQLVVGDVIAAGPQVGNVST